MPSGPDHRPPTRSVTGILVRAVLYTLAIVVLVLYAPTAQHTFIYQGF